MAGVVHFCQRRTVVRAGEERTITGALSEGSRGSGEDGHEDGGVAHGENDREYESGEMAPGLEGENCDGSESG